MNETAHITYGVETSEEVITAHVFFVDSKCGCVVGTDGAFEADFFVGANGFGHVCVAVVVEGFGEGGHLAV